MNNWDVKKRIEDAFEHYCEKAGLTPYRDVGLFYDSEMKCWGKAHWKRGGDDEETYVLINLNMMLRMPEEVEETVAHEVAHIKTSVDGYPREFHGSHWAENMMELGFIPHVTKHFDRTRKPVWAEAV